MSANLLEAFQKGALKPIKLMHNQWIAVPRNKHWLIITGMFSHITGTASVLVACDYRIPEGADVNELTVALNNTYDTWREESAGATTFVSIFKNRAFVPTPLDGDTTLWFAGDASAYAFLKVLEW